MAEKFHSGHCLCGDVRLKATGAPLRVAHCHCESCRRATASPMTTFAIYPAAQVSIVEGTPAAYQSSPGVTRTFCRRCGTPIDYRTSARPHEIDLYVCNFDNPNAFAPQYHTFTEERIAWLHLADGLPLHGTGSTGD